MAKADLSQFYALNLAVMTISDSRTASNDSSGDLLTNLSQQAGHAVVARAILHNSINLIRETLSHWMLDENIQVILINGGTGFAKGNCTVTAVSALIDTPIPGFGELFRQLSFAELGSAAMQSGALAGFAKSSLLFAMPGSGGACRLAMQHLILPQLDSRTGPCNFVAHVKNNPINSCNGA
ncbi:molybdenum cofactor synthesis domain-containing protein [Rheinheimera salexigens]|uniref:Molybdenum cofactor biosynthesis protein B n=1 Tax=Rheinheimera salexigens TaxID=1628148 RepID=A0A1E7Q7X7_9GAMM|nr:molybdenum cofactor synthesis domain-containing protein [Rheinheimera salexigens]OEY70183.1 molybdenum cofactor biosynthesis protein [Rheinheimera salexigens]